MSKISDSETSDRQVYGRLLGYVTPYWFAFLLSVFGYLLCSMSNVGFASLISYIVDSLGGNDRLADTQAADTIRLVFGSEGELNRKVVPVLIVAIVMLRGTGTFIGNYFIAYVGTWLVHNLRLELFDRLLLLPSRFYDQNSMGHLATKVTFHVAQVTGAAIDAVKVIIREGLLVIAYLGYLFYLNWMLTLVFIGVGPFIAILVGYAGRRFRRISTRIQDSIGDVTHVASEIIQGYREVRTFGGGDYEKGRFQSVSNSNRRQSMKMVVTASIATPAVQLLTSIALALLVWLALEPKLLSSMTAGDVVSFIVTAGLLAKPIRQLSEVNATVQKGLAAAEDIFEVLDEEAEVDTGVKTLEHVKGKVEFRNVNFTYDQSQTPVLKNLSFVANPGETIALVGRSGSGKSTLASLIPRFYSPDSGTILLDDEPISEITLSNLRQHLAIVTQSVTLFNDTVARNIAYGALRTASKADIREAAEKAYAWDFITALEEGLDTVVGDDGVLLSGGQRQRLAIARAFLKDAPVLILDEATSALDSESERYIQSALEAVTKGRTTIVIAHRLSTIENADRILVIDQGEIVEQGTHKELMLKGQHYANLHSHQQELEEPVEPAVKQSPYLPVPVSSDTGFKWLSQDFNPLVKGWYAKRSWVKLLAPLSIVFLAIASLRKRFAKTWDSPVPVIIVGNINVGGTGKSPLVAWLAQQLRAMGRNPGIVSRGYGGKAPSYPCEVTDLTDPAIAGDEAVMLARKTNCPVVVDRDRPAAVRLLLDVYDCDVVISDDGLQHYALGREVEIAVVDAQKGLGNRLCLPAGPLRETPGRLREVDIVVVNGSCEGQYSAIKQSDLPGHSMEMKLEPGTLINLVDDQPIKGELGSGPIHAVAGIGNPDRFFVTLRSLGYDVIEHRFEDHYKFQLSDLNFGDSLPVVMTEKDAAKCRLLKPGIIHKDFWFLSVDVEISDKFLQVVLDKAGLSTIPLATAE